MTEVESLTWLQSECLAMVHRRVRVGRRDAPKALYPHVRGCLAPRDLVTARKDDGQGDRRVEVRAGAVPESVDHAHERRRDRPDGGWRAGEDVEADSQHQEEGAEELAHQPRGEFILPELSAKVIWANHPERRCRECCPEELVTRVRSAPAEPKPGAGDVNADGDRGVEASAGDRTSTVGSGDDNETDGQAVELVAV